MEKHRIWYYHMIQQLHFWVYAQKIWKQGPEKVFAHACS